MKINYLADENIPLLVIKELKKEGLKIEYLPEKLLGMKDKELINYAREKEFILLTFDKDFGQLVFKEKVKSQGIILLRFPPISPTKIKSIIKEILTDKGFDPNGKFVVVHETHMRIVALP